MKRSLLILALLATICLGAVLGASHELMASQAAVVLVDDFGPQPLQGDQVWYYNRLGGDRGQIDPPPQVGQGTVVWGQGNVTATITSGVGAWEGAWTSLNHPVCEATPLNFSRIFPDQVQSAYQGQVTGVRLYVLDGSGKLKVELQAPDFSFPWTASVPLTGGPQTLQFSLPPLGDIRNLNWLVIGNATDFVTIDKVELLVDLPSISPTARAFLWSYSMLLANWDPGGTNNCLLPTAQPCNNFVRGLTRDRANFPYCHFDNISASGMQAAASVVAWQQGFISKASAIDIVQTTGAGLAALSTCHGLLPHFVQNGQIVPGTEWSSLDTIVSLVSLVEARQALGLETASVEGELLGIDWPSLILPNGTLSHGYDNACSQALQSSWFDFGTETWLANFGYAAATDDVASMSQQPPTFNGSGFIDELAWLLVPPPKQAYRHQAAEIQKDYYAGHSCFGSNQLFGLSAGEVPRPSQVQPAQIYQPFGVGGVIPANDGSGLLSHAVVVPHYTAMISSLRPTEALALWNWLETRSIFTPLNNVESLMFIDEPACKQVAWNELKGSWNLSLQALGWGRLLVGNTNPLFEATQDNALLHQGYEAMWGDSAADPDGDLAANGADGDDDSDGCPDNREMLSNPASGGMRNPSYFWDFFDTPPRDAVVSVVDISRVVSRFGSNGNANGYPLATPPPAPAYHTGFDRAPAKSGQGAWQTRSANGSVTVQDISLVVTSFGHSCL